MAGSDTDAATERLIAQLMADDLEEAYAEQIRPIGSDYRDYEDPLTSFERHCLENPDANEEEYGESWEVPSSQLDESPGNTSLCLPEGETWDSSVNEDSRVESQPFTKATDQDHLGGEWDSRNDLPAEDLKDEEGASGVDIGKPSDDPIHTQNQNTQSKGIPRPVSQPNPDDSPSPTSASHRNMTDPAHPEPAMDGNSKSPSPTDWSHPSPTQDTSTPQPLPYRPSHKAPRLPIPFSPRPYLATNERLLDYAVPGLDADLLNLDTYSFKNKGKAAIPTLPNDAPSLKASHHHRPKHRHDPLAVNDGEDITSHPKNKDKGKGKGKSKLIAPDPATHSEFESDSESNPDLHFDTASTLTLDPSTSPPHPHRILRIPWLGLKESPGERAFREVMEARVHEVRVGEEESLGGILMGIWERGRGKGRGMVGVGEGGGERGGMWGKGEGEVAFAYF